MSSSAVKFCGITNVDDAQAINELIKDCEHDIQLEVSGQIDLEPRSQGSIFLTNPRRTPYSQSLKYIGFVFWPKSKRLISAEEARSIREVLDPTLKTVGVFVDADPAEIIDLFEQGIISIAQLHGNEGEEYIQHLREVAPGLEIWKAFIIESAEDVNAANASTANLVLLDGGKGEGNAFPHELLAGMSRPYALAGGLAPDNVGSPLKTIASSQSNLPAVIDVSSGIEAPNLDPITNKPHKDADAMQRFLYEVNKAIKSHESNGTSS